MRPEGKEGKDWGFSFWGSWGGGWGGVRRVEGSEGRKRMAGMKIIGL